MGEPDRYGRAKVSTIRRDINRLRAAIQSHDLDAIEAAWLDCERWVDFLEAKAAEKERTDG